MIDSQMIAVVDRQTGEKGIVTQSFDIASNQRRRFVAEGLYSTGILSGSGDLSLFARAELRPSAVTDPDTSNLMGGAERSPAVLSHTLATADHLTTICRTIVTELFISFR